MALPLEMPAFLPEVSGEEEEAEDCPQNGWSSRAFRPGRCLLEEAL